MCAGKRIAVRGSIASRRKATAFETAIPVAAAVSVGCAALSFKHGIHRFSSLF
jgi:hypothetical protein